MHEWEENMGGSCILKTLFGAVVFLGLFWFLYLGILANNGTATMTRRIIVPPSRSREHLKLVGIERLLSHRHLDPYYANKRRVPNGPDPIHNRRASQARQPPGRA